MPRTILHVDGERGLRGGERQALALAGALAARGRPGVVVCRAGSELEAAARARGLRVETLPFLGEWDPMSAARLDSIARRERAVIHAHTAHAAALGAMASLGGAPFVAHRRVDFAVSRASAKLKYGRADKVVAVSKAIAEIMAGAGVPREKLVVVTDGIAINDDEARFIGEQTTQFRPPTAEERKDYRRTLSKEFGIDPAMTWVGNLAALVPHKDHETLIAAAVIALLKNPRLRFLIAGKGPEEAHLFESIKRMGLSGRVLLLGHRAEPLPLMKSLDIYCQSSWGEGMGSVLIEAAACGVPIAATTAGGIPEVVEDQASGLLALPRRPEALADVILRLASDQALAARLTDEGRRRLPRFSLTKMADDMEMIYDSLS